MCDISQNEEGEKDKINPKEEEETIKRDVEEAIREIRGSKQLEEKSRTARGSVSGGGGDALKLHELMTSIVEKLKREEINLQNILDSQEVELLLRGTKKDGALYEGRKRFENWLRKGGDKAPKTSQYDVAEAYEKMALMDTMRSQIMDYYGFTGFDRTKYRNVMNALMKALKGYGPEGYIKRAKELIAKFEVEKKYDKEVLHILTLLTLKFLVWYEEHKFELIPPSA
jgi:hypothetical protein